MTKNWRDVIKFGFQKGNLKTHASKSGKLKVGVQKGNQKVDPIARKGESKHEGEGYD